MGRASKRKRDRRTGAPPSPRLGLDAPDSVQSREALVALFLITAATVLAYSNAFDASFHWDDFTSIVRNEALRDPLRMLRTSSNRWLGYLSFALNYHLGGLEVFGYHLANLLIHLGNALLVFWLTAITLRTPALRRADTGPLVRRYLPLTAGLIFAVHPIATQAVTYIVQRFASLATLFYLLSVALYAQARLSLEERSASRVRAVGLYCLSLMAAAAAMKTKEISFTLPFVAAGYDLVCFGRGRRMLLLVPIAATALLVPIGLATRGEKLADVLGAASRFAAETQEIPRSVYLLTQSRVVVTYLRLLVLPVGQNLDYDFRLSHSLAEPDVLLALTVLVGVAALAVFLLLRARKTNRAEGVLVFFGVAWFFVSLSVESSVIPIRDVIFEHRVYLPSAGAALTLGTALLWALGHLRTRVSPRLLVGTALLFTVAPLGAATHARNLVWKDEVTLWSDVAGKSPKKARPHSNLGAAYWKKGQVDDAFREFREAIRLDPESVDAHTNLGIAYATIGEAESAVREFLVAIGLNPGDAEAHYNLGRAKWADGHLEDAMREYGEAIRLDPGLAEAHCNLGLAYDAKSQVDDAMREYRETIRLDPEDADAHRRLGGALAKQGRTADAVDEYAPGR